MALGMGLLPIVPILLLPLILIFFIVVFPLWAVALGVLGLVFLIVRGLHWLARKLGSPALDGTAKGVQKAFHWVLTFGGFTEKLKEPKQAA